ncbi:uncharacterized protein LOC133710835 isoform X1 [Rosa rugosa]|uniref:uncharacterized protein LOC133710835 isoform X1 n=1 Tax=Rosa rugosa TaxID=74645 RepID=UPI002B4036C3|nr:uncharacterized protein LOC133710835 isoform X1 [Rosa rugosa]
MKKGSTAQCVCLVDESCNWTMRPCLSSDVKLHPKPISVFSMAKVFSEPSQKWYEPEWWKFGDKKFKNNRQNFIKFRNHSWFVKSSEILPTTYNNHILT